MPGAPICIPEDGVMVAVKANVPDAATTNQCCAEGAAPEPKHTITMEDLLSQLRNTFETEKANGTIIDNQQDTVSFKRLNDRVQALLKAYSSGGGCDWQRYALFNDLHYVRNLVEANDDFELIVLCWKAGQVSRVHNHAASHCWLTVLGGGMREIQYQRVPPSDQSGTEQSQPQHLEGAAAGEEPGSVVMLEPTHTTDLQVGDVAYINDHLGLHSVGCYSHPGQLLQLTQDLSSGFKLEGGVTLHLYSPPIRRVKIYEENTVTERVPGYYSKGGVRV